MRSHHCLRIMQMRTLIVFGLFSLSVTFLLLVLHNRAQYSQDKFDSPSKIIYPNAFGGKEKKGKLSVADGDLQDVTHKEKNQFVFNQNIEEMGQNADGTIPPESYSSDSRPPLTVPRILKYCNQPDTHIQGQEGLVSKGYKLVSVQVIIRHGDRSPIYQLPSGHASELSCLMDTSQFSHVPKVVSYQHVMGASQFAQTGPFERWALYPSHTTCGMGQLTGKGAIQHILNGIHLSERYLHQHRLFNPDDWADKVLVHSTMTSRTYQSALALMYGFVPQFDIAKLNLRTATLLNFCEDKAFGIACQCPGLESLRTRAEGECRLNSEVKHSNLVYKNLMAYVSQVLGASPNSLPGATSLMDGLSAHTCHSMPYPCNANGKCVTAKVMEDIWNVIDAKSICMADNPSYAKFCRASMHGLLFRIARNFKASSENGTNARFHLYSGHDTTVNPFIISLGIKDNVWPGYAHRIVMEFYTTLDRKHNFIRVLQNGKVVTGEVIFCRNRTKDQGMCDFEHLLQYLRERNLKQFCVSLLKSSNNEGNNNEF